MGRLAAIAIGVCVLWASNASATTVVVEDGSPDYPYQAWVDSARVPTPSTTLTIREAPCPYAEATACTLSSENALYLTPGTGTERGNLMHELGHFFDYAVMTDSSRALYMAKRSLTGAWRQSGSLSPHERFADDYKSCALWYERKHGKPHFHAVPTWAMVQTFGLTAKQMGSICRLIRASSPSAS